MSGWVWAYTSRQQSTTPYEEGFKRVSQGGLESSEAGLSVVLLHDVSVWRAANTPTEAGSCPWVSVYFRTAGFGKK
eukprot:362608-Chlamydomonas_euryale.AAC.5